MTVSSHDQTVPVTEGDLARGAEDQGRRTDGKVELNISERQKLRKVIISRTIINRDLPVDDRDGQEISQALT